MTAPRTARDRARLEVGRAIQEAGRRQLAEVGPAALSLRAIAREVGMVSSAVYRYFPSRDDLLTALIIEAYDELGDALDDADAAVRRRGDLVRRLRAYGDALRDWARAHPHEYALLYGSPVPDYAAPQSTVVPAGRVTGALLRLAERAQDDGRTPVATRRLTPAESAALEGVRPAVATPLDDALLLRWLMAWTTLFGHLSLELFGHMHRGVLDYDAHWAQVLEQLADDLGLR